MKATEPPSRASPSDLPTYTSDTSCSYHGHSINLHIGLTHDSCLLFEPSDVSLVRQAITGLVGTNGAGKSSLAKLIASKEIPDFPQSLSIQYVFSSHEAYAFDEEEYNNLKPHEYMASIAQERLKDLNAQIEVLEEGLETDNSQPTHSPIYSVSTEWLVEKTKDAALEGNTMVLIISHKEALLQSLCDRIWYINSATHRLSTFHTEYDTFRSTHEADMDHAAKTVDAFDSKVNSAEASLRSIRSQLDKREAKTKEKTTRNADKRFVKGKNKEAKQKADKSAASKLKQLKHDVANLEETKHQAKRERVKQLKLEGSCASGTLVVFQEVSFRYDDDASLVFDCIDARIEPTDRILLRGENGTGRSTFLKLALGELEATEGTITRNLQSLYFPQTSLIEMTMNHGQESAMAYLSEGNVSLTQTEARNHLGNFGIPDVAMRSIFSLSAGQRVRLWLAKQQLGGKRPSLLVLDEVSENLDVDTKNSLLDVLNSFVGAVIVVSHDEDFCIQFKPSQVWTIDDSSPLRAQFPS